MNLSDLKLDQSALLIQLAVLVFAFAKLVAEANKSFKLITSWWSNNKRKNRSPKAAQRAATVPDSPTADEDYLDPRPAATRDFVIMFVLCSLVLLSQIFVGGPLTGASAAISVFAGTAIVISYLGTMTVRLAYIVFRAQSGTGDLILASTKVAVDAIRSNRQSALPESE